MVINLLILSKASFAGQTLANIKSSLLNEILAHEMTYMEMMKNERLESLLLGHESFHRLRMDILRDSHSTVFIDDGANTGHFAIMSDPRAIKDEFCRSNLHPRNYDHLS